MICHLGLVWKPRNPSVPRDFPEREIRGTSSPGKFIATFGSQRDVELQPASLRFPRGKKSARHEAGSASPSLGSRVPTPRYLRLFARESRRMGETAATASHATSLSATMSPYETATMTLAPAPSQVSPPPPASPPPSPPRMRSLPLPWIHPPPPAALRRHICCASFTSQDLRLCLGTPAPLLPPASPCLLGFLLTSHQFL